MSVRTAKGGLKEERQLTRNLTPAQLLWEEQEAEAGGSGHWARERAPQGKGGGRLRGRDKEGG